MDGCTPSCAAPSPDVAAAAAAVPPSRWRSRRTAGGRCWCPALVGLLAVLWDQRPRRAALLGLVFGLAQMLVPAAVGAGHRPRRLGGAQPARGVVLRRRSAGRSSGCSGWPGGRSRCAALWVLLELGRSQVPFTGFPWGRLAFAHRGHAPRRLRALGRGARAERHWWCCSPPSSGGRCCACGQRAGPRPLAALVGAPGRGGRAGAAGRARRRGRHRAGRGGPGRRAGHRGRRARASSARSSTTTRRRRSSTPPTSPPAGPTRPTW